MLNKPKYDINRFDLPLGLAVILALLALVVQPFSSVQAENEILSNLRQNSSSVGLILEESTEGKMFFPPVEIKKPDKNLKAVISFYSSTPGQTDSSPFIAADGTRVFDGMIANNCLPFGTEVKIPALYGDKIFKVHDRMNKRYGCSKFDIWMDAPVKELRKLGIKRAELEVYYAPKKIKEIVKNK